MQEIKLKVWVKKDKAMSPPATIIDLVRTGVKYPESSKHFANSLEDDSSILMQYTGFKDAKNTEIYDGDIVEYFTIIRIVGWNEETGQWCLKRSLDQKAKYTQQLATVELQKSEVIGNIYENPELIKPL